MQYDGDGQRSLTDGGDRVSRSEGDGASPFGDDRSARGSLEANDGRSGTNTYFKQYDDVLNPVGPPQKHRSAENTRSWQSLASWNDGVGDPARAQENRDAYRESVAQTLSNQSGLTPYQRDRVVYIVNGMEFGEIKNYRYPAEHVILAIVSLVADEDTDAFENRITNRDTFQTLMDDIGIETSGLWSVREVLRTETDFF